MLLEKIKQTISQHNLVQKNDKVILALSGGHDSRALLDILSKLKKEYNLKIILAHVNYGYRGKDSDDDEKFVRKLAKKYKLKLYAKKLQATIRPRALLESAFDKLMPRARRGEPRNRRHGREASYKLQANLEAYFRQIRYAFFEEVLKKEKAQKIALAHTLDDQTETILMFFLRGSGFSGLSGMKYKRGKIIRPFLDISRTEIDKYLKENRLKWRRDITNEDISFTRNKIRHRLIPLLEKEFNPNLKNTLKMMARVISENENLLDDLVKETYGKILRQGKTAAATPAAKKLFFNFKRFLLQKPGLKKLLLRKILSAFGQDKVSFLFLEDVLKMIELGRTGAKKIVGNVQILKKKRWLVVEKINTRC